MVALIKIRNNMCRLLRHAPGLLVLIAWLTVSAAQAQNTISRAEYFVDTDPGVGLGTFIPVSAGNDSTSFTGNITLPNNLSGGLHYLYVRTQLSSNGAWALHEYRPFLVNSSTTIAAAEWFIDTDPGVGQATAISITSALDSVGLTGNISVPANIGGGVHYLYIRTRTLNGVWGLYESRPFIVTSSGTIAAAEWFIDADPGVGQATALSITQGLDSITSTNSITVPSGMTGGMHYLHIRTRSLSGVWGLYESRPFIVTGSTTIAAAEWFIDADPGVGHATAISISTGADSIAGSASISVPSGISGGLHFLHIRTRTLSGIWGHYESRPFTVNSSSTIAAAEWFIDADPGVGHGTAITVTSGRDSIVASPSIALPSSISSGRHYLFIRTRTQAGIWGLYEPQPFTVKQSIVAAEYFFDIDPGVGHGSSIAVVAGFDSISVSASISAACIDSGSHWLYIRTRSRNGQWSLYERDSVYINAPAPYIIAGGSTTICTGDSVILTANTGAGCSYQWYLNGSPIPAAMGQVYIARTAGDFTLHMTSGTVAYVSNQIHVANCVGTCTPTVSLSAINTNLDLPGSRIMTATWTNGGVNPYLTWYLNGVAIANIHSSVLSYGGALGNGDQIYCTMAPVTGCAVTRLATSNAITFTKSGSSVKDITSLLMPAQVGTSVINTTNATVRAVVTTAPALRTAIHPIRITVSLNAAYGPSYIINRDFSMPVTYTVRAQDGSTRVWTVTVLDQSGNKVFGINDIAFTGEINVYPSPASQYVNVMAAGGADAPVITILDIEGRVMYNQALPVTDIINHQVDLSDFAAGSYIMYVAVGEKVQSRQFVVGK